MLFHNADEALRALIWRRFAAMVDSGPVRCVREYHHKIVFDERMAAVGAARQLTRLDGQVRYVHACGDHWHTTRKPNKEGPV
jgi:hypothetical protein